MDVLDDGIWYCSNVICPLHPRLSLLFCEATSLSDLVDIILGREDAASDSRIEVKVPMCFYDVLAGYFSLEPENGKPILTLILFEVQLDSAYVLLRYSSALVQGATNVFWYGFASKSLVRIDIQTNTRHFQSVFKFLLVDVALVPEKLKKIPLQSSECEIVGIFKTPSWVSLFPQARELKRLYPPAHISVRFSIVNESVRTCPAAMGFAFAAGTTDGPGAFDFTQGDDQLVGGLLKKPDEKQIKGQDPKPILIDSGEMHEPYDWALYVRVNKKRMLLIGFAGSSFDLIRLRLLLLFRIDALLDFFHMVIFSLMVHHMEVLWVGLGFVFVKQEDEDDDDGGVILRLDEGMNGINVLDYVEVFGDTSVPFQHPLLMEPSSSRAIST
ncbi:neutral ceramidase [Tanacetum coccineum]